MSLRTLWRPVGPRELQLIEENQWKRFPPRLPEQPIFYPVCNERYAREIADRWNTPSDGGGFVTRFSVREDLLAKYPVQIVGKSYHAEHWIPADELDAFNNAIEGVIEVVPPTDDHGARAAYDTVAEAYAQRMLDELQHKPLDRALLNFFAERMKDQGKVLDIGTGPGHIARYLSDRGTNIEGIDLSPAMVTLAQRVHSEVSFLEADFCALPFADSSIAGIIGFYAIVHLQETQLDRAMKEFFRVIAHKGSLLLSFHLGTERVHLDTWWEQSVSVDFFFHRRETVEQAMKSAGFTIEAAIERQPYPNAEHPSERCYLLATKPQR